MKCPPEAHMSEHLVPNWWCYLGLSLRKCLWAWALSFDGNALLPVQALFPECGPSGARCLLLLLPWFPHHFGLYSLEGKPNKPFFQPLSASTGKEIDKLWTEFRFKNNEMVVYALSPVHLAFRMSINIPNISCKNTSMQAGQRLMLVVFLDGAALHLLRQGLSLNSELIDSAGLGCPEEPLLPSEHWDYRWASRPAKLPQGYLG